MTATTRELKGVRRERAGRGGGVRLTRRGRLVLVVLAASILLMGLWMTAGRGASAGPAGGHGVSPPSGGRLEVVTVGTHDTLWDIAARNRPADDPRITVQRMIDLNALPGAIIQPGQRLALPGH